MSWFSLLLITSHATPRMNTAIVRFCQIFQCNIWSCENIKTKLNMKVMCIFFFSLVWPVEEIIFLMNLVSNYHKYINSICCFVLCIKAVCLGYIMPTALKCVKQTVIQAEYWVSPSYPSDYVILWTMGLTTLAYWMSVPHHSPEYRHKLSRKSVVSEC